MPSSSTLFWTFRFLSRGIVKIPYIETDTVLDIQKKLSVETDMFPVDDNTCWWTIMQNNRLINRAGLRCFKMRDVANPSQDLYCSINILCSYHIRKITHRNMSEVQCRSDKPARFFL